MTDFPVSRFSLSRPLYHTVLAALFLIFCSFTFAQNWNVSLTDKDKAKLITFVADKEFSGDWSQCVDWNKGEAFPSLGLGHYLWFPKGSQSPFEESFPKFIDYVVKNTRGVRFPAILGMDSKGRIQPAPWSNRDEFLRTRHSQKTQELVTFLSEPKMRLIQLEYQMQRLKSIAGNMAAFQGFPGDAPQLSTASQRSALLQELFRFPNGIALLIHYPTFKGDGMKASERYTYNGKKNGWGLFQVIDRAASFPDSHSKVKAYRQLYVAKTPSIAKVRVAAEEILTERANRDYTTISVGSSTRQAYIKSWNRALSVYGKIIR